MHKHILDLIEDTLQCGRCVHLGNVKLLIIDLRTEVEHKQRVRKQDQFLCVSFSGYIFKSPTSVPLSSMCFILN